MAVNTLSLGGLIDAMISARLQELHTAFPAIITSYNNSKQTIEVTPAVKHTWVDINGVRQAEQLPKLVDVPVLWPRGGDFFISFPLAVGDTVLIVITESALEKWRTKNTTVDPSDTRRFDLSDAVAIPGLFSTPKALATTSSTRMILGKDSGIRIELDNGSNLICLGSSAPSEFVALATKTNNRISALETKLNNHITAYNTHVHPTAAVGAPSLPSVIDTTLTPGASVASTKVKAD